VYTPPDSPFQGPVIVSFDGFSFTLVWYPSFFGAHRYILECLCPDQGTMGGASNTRQKSKKKSGAKSKIVEPREQWTQVWTGADTLTVVHCSSMLSERNLLYSASQIPKKYLGGSEEQALSSARTVTKHSDVQKPKKKRRSTKRKAASTEKDAKNQAPKTVSHPRTTKSKKRARKKPSLAKSTSSFRRHRKQVKKEVCVLSPRIVDRARLFCLV